MDLEELEEDINEIKLEKHNESNDELPLLVFLINALFLPITHNFIGCNCYYVIPFYIQDHFDNENEDWYFDSVQMVLLYLFTAYNVFNFLSCAVDAFFDKGITLYYLHIMQVCCGIMNWILCLIGSYSEKPWIFIILAGALAGYSFSYNCLETYCTWLSPTNLSQQTDLSTNINRNRNIAQLIGCAQPIIYTAFGFQALCFVGCAIGGLGLCSLLYLGIYMPNDPSNTTEQTELLKKQELINEVIDGFSELAIKDPSKKSKVRSRKSRKKRKKKIRYKGLSGSLWSLIIFTFLQTWTHEVWFSVYPFLLLEYFEVNECALIGMGAFICATACLTILNDTEYKNKYLHYPYPVCIGHLMIAITMFAITTEHAIVRAIAVLIVFTGQSWSLATIDEARFSISVDQIQVQSSAYGYLYSCMGSIFGGSAMIAISNMLGTYYTLIGMSFYSLMFICCNIGYYYYQSVKLDSIIENWALNKFQPHEEEMDGTMAQLLAGDTFDEWGNTCYMVWAAESMIDRPLVNLSFAEKERFLSECIFNSPSSYADLSNYALSNNSSMDLMQLSSELSSRGSAYQTSSKNELGSNEQSSSSQSDDEFMLYGAGVDNNSSKNSAKKDRSRERIY